MADDVLQEKTIQVVGAGATGSYLVYLLSQESDIFNPKIIVWDDDIVSSHNIRVSIYSKPDIGKKKLEALQEVMKQKNETELVTVNKFWKDGEQLYECNFLVLAVDDITTRKKLVKSYMEQFPDSNTIFIDPRLGSDEIQVISFTKDDIEQYFSEWIFDPSQVYKPEEGRACRILKTPPYLSMKLACEIYRIINEHSKTGLYVNLLTFKSFN